MRWNKETIVHKIYDGIDKGLEQRYDQVLNVLKHKSSNEIFDVLHFIFLDESRPKTKRVIDQEYAGKLLWVLNPSCPIEAESVIKSVLRNYELSVEELPWYFSKVFGREQMLGTLDKIESQELLEIEKKSLRTFRFWLSISNY